VLQLKFEVRVTNSSYSAKNTTWKRCCIIHLPT